MIRRTHNVETSPPPVEGTEYGKAIVESLAKKLTQEYGKGYSRAGLFRMVKFAEVFPDQEIVSSLMRQLSWTHIIEIIYLKDELRRRFYAEMCVIEGWSVSASGQDQATAL